MDLHATGKGSYDVMTRNANHEASKEILPSVGQPPAWLHESLHAEWPNVSLQLSLREKLCISPSNQAHWLYEKGKEVEA